MKNIAHNEAEQVPDDVFAQKIMGDGVAVMPEDGLICSPVDGTVVTVAETLHAYGFQSEDGVELLVHFGLETVALGGKGFTPHVKAGDKVKAGQLIAEADMEFFKAQGVNMITPVVICGGTDGNELEFEYGEMKAGDVIIHSKEGADNAEKTDSPTDEMKEKQPEKKKKFGINFDFLQKL